MIVSSSKISADEPLLLQAVLSYQNPSLVQRLKAKCGLTLEEAIDLFDDTKRFLYLCAESSALMTPPPAIDEGWHHFILFTKDYACFCEQYFGMFIHHRPRYIDDPPFDQRQVQATLREAQNQFGQLSKNWNYAEANSNCDNCSRCSG